jgi:hypothetical protein
MAPSFETMYHAKHIIYYKREGDGVPQVRAMVNLVNQCLPVVHQCTKNVPTMC